MEQAVIDANNIYKEQLTISTKALKEDLQCIHNHMATVLAKAREDANNKIAQFKAHLVML